MPVGSGKYDELCTYVREQTRAEGVILVVLDGTQGTGFEVQGILEVHLKLPAMLREVADKIELGGVPDAKRPIQ